MVPLDWSRLLHTLARGCIARFSQKGQVARMVNMAINLETFCNILAPYMVLAVQLNCIDPKGHYLSNAECCTAEADAVRLCSGQLVKDLNKETC